MTLCGQNYNRAVLKERGVTFVEVALTLPIFLAFILFFTWMGMVWGARSSLTSAMGNGVRLAVTRGNEELMGKQVYPEIQNRDVSHLEKLLVSPDLREAGALSYYDEKLFGFPVTDDVNVPPEYLYALAYTLQAMSQSEGGQVRYPCDPNGNGADSGAGCVSCGFIDTAPFGKALPTDANEAGKIFAMQCDFQPPLSLLSPAIKMLGAIIGSQNVPRIIVRRTKFVDASAG